MAQGELKQRLGLYGLTMIAVGSCIGAGIFKTPSQIVAELPHHGWVLIVWAIGGLITLTGALTFAELGARFPKSGGVYVFLREAYGEVFAFSYGWITLLVINTGSLAALALIFADYMGYFVDLSDIGKLILAAGLIISLTLFNILGVDKSQRLISTFTTLKILAIIGIVLIAAFASTFTAADFQPALSDNQPENLLSAMLLALIGVLWSFGGWHHASYLAGETKNAKRTVPKAMILGTIIVTLIYLAVNWAYMNMLPLGQIANSKALASDALAALPYGGEIVAGIICVSIFGTISIYTMSAPRIYQVMAEDKIFFKKMAEIHPKYGTPAAAMLFQALWATLLLVAWGTFHDLITYVAFADLAFMLLAGMSIFIFRKRAQLQSDEYAVPLYPIVPMIFGLITAAFVVNTLIQKPQQSLAGLLLLALGLPIFFYFKKNNKA